MNLSSPDGLTDEQRAWAVHSEALWARAAAIATAHPEVDAGDVYHALRCLELSLSPRDCDKGSPVEDFALTPAERALFDALNRRDVPFIIIGMGAAVLEGAPIATQDLDVWFARADDDHIKLAAADAGGYCVSRGRPWDMPFGR